MARRNDPEKLTVRGFARALRRAVECGVIEREAFFKLVCLVDDAAVGMAVEFDEQSDRPLLEVSANALQDAWEILEAECPKEEKDKQG